MRYSSTIPKCENIATILLLTVLSCSWHCFPAWCQWCGRAHQGAAQVQWTITSGSEWASGTSSLQLWACFILADGGVGYVGITRILWPALCTYGLKRQSMVIQYTGVVFLPTQSLHQAHWYWGDSKCLFAHMAGGWWWAVVWVWMLDVFWYSAPWLCCSFSRHRYISTLIKLLLSTRRIVINRVSWVSVFHRSFQREWLELCAGYE